MQITISKTDLASAINFCAKIIRAKVIHPVLSNLHIIADMETQKLKFISTNLSVFNVVEIKAVIKASGEIAIPAKLFKDVILKSKGDIEIQTDEAFCMKIKHSGGNVSIVGISPVDFPDVPIIPTEEPECEVTPDSLKQILSGIVHSVSKDITKQLMTGVNVRVLPTHFEFASTDGHQLSVGYLTTDTTAFNPSYSFILGPDCLKELEDMIKKSPVGIQKSKSEPFPKIKFQIDLKEFWVKISWGTQAIIGRLLEPGYLGYADYDRLIPNEFRTEVHLKTKDLLTAVEQIDIFGSQAKYNIFRLIIDGNTNCVEAAIDITDLGHNSMIVPAIEILQHLQDTDEKVECYKFNTKYILNFLSATPSETLTLYITKKRDLIISRSEEITNQKNGDVLSFLHMVAMVLTRK